MYACSPYMYTRYARSRATPVVSRAVDLMSGSAAIDGDHGSSDRWQGGSSPARSRMQQVIRC